MKASRIAALAKKAGRLANGENHYIDRFVYSYILLGKKVCLIDAGVWGTAPLLQNYLKQIGRSPGEISMVPITHAHLDHIGGCLAIKKASSASFYAHPADKPWIEDVEKTVGEDFFRISP